MPIFIKYCVPIGMRRLRQGLSKLLHYNTVADAYIICICARLNKRKLYLNTTMYSFRTLMHISTYRDATLVYEMETVFIPHSLIILIIRAVTGTATSTSTVVTVTTYKCLKFNFLRNISKSRKFAIFLQILLLRKLERHYWKKCYEHLNFKFLRNRVTITIYPQTLYNILRLAFSLHNLIFKGQFFLLAFELRIDYDLLRSLLLMVEFNVLRLELDICNMCIFSHSSIRVSDKLKNKSTYVVMQSIHFNELFFRFIFNFNLQDTYIHSHHKIFWILVIQFSHSITFLQTIYYKINIATYKTHLTFRCYSLQCIYIENRRN
ncbi:hypothetical protein AGLY_011890 [Aphis glycines]|uniref:Uncharacterized protein n=1 Tax=Aphis glycines TaxID=307491 RepID=A0A6G0TDM9_APHGL|nr:hypothetical protein AGLY_011890 [Aphis glycines]